VGEAVNGSTNGCLQAIGILFGFFLLLPGACSVIVFFISPHQALAEFANPDGIFVIWLGGLILGVGGIFILIKLLRSSPGR
jgi:hypothetical protein